MLQGSSHGSALVIRVLGGGQPRLLDLSTYLPTCGRPPFATSSALPLWKLALSQWCGASRVCACGGLGFGGARMRTWMLAPPPAERSVLLDPA